MWEARTLILINGLMLLFENGLIVTLLDGDLARQLIDALLATLPLVPRVNHGRVVVFESAADTNKNWHVDDGSTVVNFVN